jgi:hypothetical protein
VVVVVVVVAVVVVIVVAVVLSSWERTYYFSTDFVHIKFLGYNLNISHRRNV